MLFFRLDKARIPLIHYKNSFNSYALFANTFWLRNVHPSSEKNA
jgi:hypothetical protein